MIFLKAKFVHGKMVFIYNLRNNKIKNTLYLYNESQECFVHDPLIWIYYKKKDAYAGTRMRKYKSF